MAEHSHEHQHHTSGQMGKHGRPYAKFWVNMVLGLVVMYFVMFSMIDGARELQKQSQHALHGGHYVGANGHLHASDNARHVPNRRLNLVLYGLFAVHTRFFAATRAQTGIGDRQFIASVGPGTIRERSSCAARAQLSDPELVNLCQAISDGQRAEIEQMNRIAARLR